MSTKQTPPPQKMEIVFYLGGARAYRAAADVLLNAHQSTPMSLAPVYMLYFHAAELALKAFLFHKGETADRLKDHYRHNLIKLHADAVKQGLIPTYSLDLRNIVNLLHSGNRNESFRYFTLESRTLPEIQWASAAVNELITLVETQTGYKPTPPGPIRKFDLVVGRPYPKM